MNERVAIALSGGVDSSVAALLVRESGRAAFGLFMNNWEDDGTGACTAARDHDDAAEVADRLGIPFYSVDFRREYRERVFADFLAEYAAGRTPNPDVLCNREIKFAALLEHARGLGATRLVTGHYCRSEGGRLFKAADEGKDQSYFLCEVPSRALAVAEFPLARSRKADVRALAREAGLPTSSKKDSTGICFIGERRFRPFLAKYLEPKPGDIRRLDGSKIGEHPGAHLFTLGQRQGLGLGGAGDPWFVVAKAGNTLYVERGADHPALYSRELLTGRFSWISERRLPARLHAKIRYRQADQACEAFDEGKGRIRVVFDSPQRAATPGQSLVLYDGEECLGGGPIEEVVFQDAPDLGAPREPSVRRKSRESRAGRGSGSPRSRGDDEGAGVEDSRRSDARGRGQDRD